jgi:hypothetical protein
MSLSAISAVASAALPTVNFHPRGHHRGVRPDNGLSNTSAAAGSVGQLPVGATSGLFNQLLQSLQHTVNAQSAAVSAANGSTTAAAATGTPIAAAAGTNLQQDLQAFMHSLLQAAGTTGAAGASTAAPPAIAATGSGAIAVTGPYQGSFVSSLQTLIRKLGAAGPPTAATSNLQTSFNRLVNDLGSGKNTGSSSPNSASNPSSNAALQNFLSNLTQNLQTNGVHSLASVGAHVNANI